MNKARTLVPLWLFLVAAVVFGYNNCSKINFDTSPEILKQQLLEFNSTSSILINGGAPYTNSRQVQLSLYSPRGVDMKISNEKDCSDGAWEPYLTAKGWTLSKSNDQVFVYVQFKDLRGDVSTCVNADIVHDDIPPVATFSSPANFVTKNANTTVMWTASDSGSGVDSASCMGPGGPAPCSTSLSVNSTAEGVNSVTVKVTDKAGNVSPDYAYNWLYDKTPPTIVINSQPASVTGSGNAALTFTAADTGSGVDKIYCQLDAAAAQPCVSPANYSGLAAGAHVFKTYAVDKAGNSSATASANWTVDMTAPTIRFTQTPPADSNSAQGTFAFDGNKNGTPITNFQCHLDGASFTDCTSPITYSGLSEGTHSFEFTGTDNYNNTSSPLKYTWVVDLHPPAVTITAGPPALTNMTTANLAWTASDALSGIKTVECKLDSAAYAVCDQNAIAYSGLLAGAHTFYVRATDMAGNSATATRAWTIDLTPPVVTITAGPNPFVNSLTASFSFTATDSGGISGYECKVDNNAYAPCTSPTTTSNQNEGSHIFYVRATDNAGNVSAPATRSWTLDLSPPIIRVISAPVTLKAGDSAVIQYEVVDLSSGVDVVKCGLTAPSGAVANCQAAATVNLGPMNAGGDYTFEIQATDKVGNFMKESVSYTVTAKPVICDPFVVGGDATCNGGLVGDIYYLNSAKQSQFQALSNKTVDFYYSQGTKVNAILNLKQLFVSTRAFDAGFPTSGGQLITDNTGKTLTSYFAFRLNTVLKLDALNDTPGWYQFATLSDDGSVVNMTPQPGSPAQLLIGNDGDHSTKMGCGQQAVYVDDTTRMGMEIKYYQGPPTEIALVLMWRKVSGPNATLDKSCGLEGNNEFFGAPPYTNFTSSGYATLLSRGWKVIAPSNFVAPPTNTGI